MLSYAVPYQRLTAHQFRCEKRARLLTKLETGMGRIEVSQRFYVRTSAMMSYVASNLMNDPCRGGGGFFIPRS